MEVKGKIIEMFKMIFSKPNHIPKPVWAIGFALEQPLRDATLA
jgi:hypothetical protein